MKYRRRCNMARKKRLNTAAILSDDNQSVLIEKAPKKEKQYAYKTALYVRLSVEDSGKENGDSIENQISLVEKFIEGKDEFEFYHLYVDNGSSGVNFSRPAFSEMMDAIKAGKVNCVIVKDLSRLGRNYLDAGTYLEQIFPFYHVRFISVMDGYDSLHSNAVDEGMIIPLKNLINASYAKDISKKVSSAMQVKMRQGKYLGNHAPYGYEKDPKDKGHLLIDQKVSGNVRMIFEWFLQGMSLGKIARQLNEQGILCPARYLHEQGVYHTDKHKNSIWRIKTVKTILQNHVYIGEIIAGKERTSIIEGINRKAMKEEEWYISKNMHEAIISEKDFYLAQDRLGKIKEDWDKYAYSYNDFVAPNLYKGKIRCAKCGRAMKLVKVIRGKGAKYEKRVADYFCSGFKDCSEEKCKDVVISKKELDQAIEAELKLHLKTFVDTEQMIAQLNRTPKVTAACEDIQKQIRMKKSRICKLQSLNEGIYEDLKDEVIDEKEYLSLRKSYANEIKETERQVAQLENTLSEYTVDFHTKSDLAAKIKECVDFKELTKEYVDNFLLKIMVDEGKRVTVTYNFEDEFKELLNILEKREKEEANE